MGQRSGGVMTSEKSDLVSFSTLYRISPEWSAKVEIVEQTNGSEAGSFFAMKSVAVPPEAQKKCVLRRERDILALTVNINCPFLQKIHCAFQSTSPDFAHLVTEVYPGGSLETFIEERGGIRFEERAGRFYLAEVVSALEFLHAKLIIHADVKAGNVFLKRSGHVVLGDFDCAVQVASRDDFASGVKGTAKYMAPEIPTEQFSFPADIWCVGMLAVELMVEEPRFVPIEWDWPKIAQLVRRGFALKPRVANRLSQKLRSFITATLQRDQTARPSIDKLRHLRFLNSITKWDDVVQTQGLEPPFRDLAHLLQQPKVFSGQLVVESAEEGEWLPKYPEPREIHHTTRESGPGEH